MVRVDVADSDADSPTGHFPPRMPVTVVVPATAFVVAVVQRLADGIASRGE